MHTSQIVVRESENWIADLLRGTAATWKWTLREPRTEETCLTILREAGPGGLFILELGSDLDKELLFFDRITRFYPETPAIAVPTLGGPVLGVLWDLGATYVLAPDQPRDLLLAIVVRLMETARETLPHG